MKKRKTSVFQAIADSLDIPEAEVIDNEDGMTVTVLGMTYQYVEFEIPRRHEGKLYHWAMFPIELL